MTATVVAANEEPAILAAGNLQVDMGRYQVSVEGEPVALTYQEFELLRLLVAFPDRILPYDDITRGLWRSADHYARRRLGVVVCRLRAKLAGSRPYHIQTVRGRGYGLTAEPRQA